MRTLVREREQYDYFIGKLMKTTPREDFIAIVYTFVPQYIKNFCINWKHLGSDVENKKLFDEFVAKTKNMGWKPSEIKTDRKTFYEMFKVDDEYRNNAQEICQATENEFWEYLYIVINYIDDYSPIRKNRELTEHEKQIVKNLISTGQSYNQISNAVEEICKVYNCENIDDALNFFLMDNY